MKHILMSRILPASCVFSVPTLPFGAGDAPEVSPNPGPGDIPFTPDETVTVRSDQNAAEDTPADFSGIGKAIEKEVGNQPEKKTEEKKEEKREEKKEEKKEERKEEKKTEEKKPEEKKEEKKQEQKKEESKKEEKKAEEKKGEKKELPKDDKDIEAIQPRPGSSQKTENDFKALKDIAKDARAHAREVELASADVRKELDALKAAGITVETAAKLKTLEDDLRQREDILITLQAEHHPKFTKEWEEKQQKADTTLLTILEQLGMKKEETEKLQKAGLDSFNEAFWEENVLKKLNTLNRQRVVNAIIGREQVKAARAEKLSELKTNKDGFIAEMQGRDRRELEDFAQRSEKHSIKLVGKEEWANKKEVPKDATNEEKKAIEKHNAAIDERIEKCSRSIMKAFQRDPEATTEMAIRSLQADMFEEQVKALQSEKEELEARVADLEKRLGGKRKAGEIEPSSEKQPEPAKNPAPKIGQSAGEAIAGYNWGGGGGQQ